jgi:hypothetical protein
MFTGQGARSRAGTRGMAMLASLTLPIFILCAVAIWTAYASFSNTQHAQRQLQTLQHGISCRATVVGVQGPFLFDPYTRVYFEFVPAGSAQPVRGCHIERRASTEVAMVLPATGGQVQVAYLPENPQTAVIGKLLGAVH